jgi:hypothetical protein
VHKRTCEKNKDEAKSDKREAISSFGLTHDRDGILSLPLEVLDCCPGTLEVVGKKGVGSSKRGQLTRRSSGSLPASLKPKRSWHRIRNRFPCSL